MVSGPRQRSIDRGQRQSGVPLHIAIGSDGAAIETARAARERGYEALVLVPRGAPTVRAFPRDVRAHDLDERNPDWLARRFQGATCIHYCCGTTGYPIDGEEPERLARILQAASKTGAKIVYCDAPYAYGVSGRPLSEEMAARARDPLGSFLAALAQFVLETHSKGKIEAVIARHADLVGPQIVRSPFGEAFVDHVLRGQPVTVFGRKDAPRSLTYSRDFGRALILLSEEPEAAGQVWHLPSTPPVSPEKLAGTLRAYASLPPGPAAMLHETAARGIGGILGAKPVERSLTRLHESTFTLLSAKFERAFGMHATDLREIARDTVFSLLPA